MVILNLTGSNTTVTYQMINNIHTYSIILCERLWRRNVNVNCTSAQLTDWLNDLFILHRLRKNVLRAYTQPLSRFPFCVNQYSYPLCGLWKTWSPISALPGSNPQPSDSWSDTLPLDQLNWLNGDYTLNKIYKGPFYLFSIALKIG